MGSLGRLGTLDMDSESVGLHQYETMTRQLIMPSQILQLPRNVYRTLHCRYSAG